MASPSILSLSRTSPTQDTDAKAEKPSKEQQDEKKEDRTACQLHLSYLILSYVDSPSQVLLQDLPLGSEAYAEVHEFIVLPPQPPHLLKDVHRLRRVVGLAGAGRDAFSQLVCDAVLIRMASTV
eukprot:scaffold434_cov186-Pinguiococcus_pyrenoidosus.AAC.75